MVSVDHRIDIDRSEWEDLRHNPNLSIDQVLTRREMLACERDGVPHQPWWYEAELACERAGVTLIGTPLVTTNTTKRGATKELTFRTAARENRVQEYVLAPANGLISQG